MNVQDAVLSKLRSLPINKQMEVLNFVEFLSQKKDLKNKRKSLKGLWEGLSIDILDQDIQDTRKEMWKNFGQENTK